MSRTKPTGPQLAVALGSLQVDDMEAGQVEAAMGDVTRVRGWLDSLEGRLASRARALEEEGSGGGARESLALSGRRSGREAQKAAARSETLAANPELDDALANGDVSTDHIDALTRAAAPLPEAAQEDLLTDPEVIDAATRMSPDPFNTFVKKKARNLAEDEGEDKLQKQKNATKLRTWFRKDGMLVINGELDPETGDRLVTDLENQIETMAQRDRAPKNDHTRALALAELVNRGAGAGSNPSPSQVVVVDAATVDDGLHDHSVCETSRGNELPPSTVRRLMCDAVIFPTVIRASDGQVLFCGRDIRTANRAQRRALRAMYPTCAFDSCRTPFDHCQIHHIVPWEHGGLTDLDNLLPLCSRHHHLVHEGRWQLRLLPDRELQILRPDGNLHTTVPLPSLDLARSLAARANKGGGPRASRPPDKPDHNQAA